MSPTPSPAVLNSNVNNSGVQASTGMGAAGSSKNREEIHREMRSKAVEVVSGSESDDKGKDSQMEDTGVAQGGKNDGSASPTSSTNSAKENSIPKKRPVRKSINRNLTITYSPKKRKRASTSNPGSAIKKEVEESTEPTPPPQPPKRGRGRRPGLKAGVVADSAPAVSEPVIEEEKAEVATVETATASSSIDDVASRRSASKLQTSVRGRRKSTRIPAAKEEVDVVVETKLEKENDVSDTLNSTVVQQDEEMEVIPEEVIPEKDEDEKDTKKIETSEEEDRTDSKKKSTRKKRKILVGRRGKKPVKVEEVIVEKEEEQEPEEDEDNTTESSSGSSSSDSDSEDNEKDVYVVERIDGKRVVSGIDYYFIKWKGWHEDSNTWEPLANLNGCSELLDAFEKQYAEKKSKRRTVPGGPGRKRRESGLDDSRIMDDGPGHSNMVSHTVYPQWPEEKEPISVEGVVHIDGVLSYIVKRKTRLGSDKLDRHNAILVYGESFKILYPDLVIQFYEKRILWTDDGKDSQEKAEIAAQMALLRQNAGSQLGKIIENDMDQQVMNKYNVEEASLKLDEETQRVDMSDDGTGKKIGLEDMDTQATDEVVDNDNFGLPEDMEDTDVSTGMSDGEEDNKGSKKKKNLHGSGTESDDDAIIDVDDQAI